MIAFVELERVALGAGWGGKPLDCEAPLEEEEREPIKSSLSIVLLLGLQYATRCLSAKWPL